MSERDTYVDQAEMKSWDCAIAVLLIGIVPIATYFVFFNRVLWDILPLFGLLLVISLVVFLLVSLTGWVIVGRIINVIGYISSLVFCYFIYVIWDASDAFDMPKMGEKRELVIPLMWK